MSSGLSTPDRKRAIRVRRALVAVAAVAGPLLLAPAAAAVTDVGGVGIFALDGNPDPGGAPLVDWEDLFGATGAPLTVSLGSAGSLIERTFVPDAPQPDASYFASNGGGVKDIAPIGSWGCKSQNQPTPKDDVFNAYAMMAQVAPGTGGRAGHLMLYLGSERQQNQGSAYAGFWINQDELVCDIDAGAFTGSRTNGDLLVVVDYLSGGGVEQIAAYEWVGGATTTSSTANLVPLLVATGVTNADCASATAAADLCATTNGLAVTTPWAPTTPRDVGTFVEAGLDLTALYARRNQQVPCFSQVFAETRSSRELTATLKDFAEDDFDTCRPPTVTTNLYEDLAVDRTLAPQVGGTAADYTVTLPALVYDTAAITGTTGTLSGTVTYSLWRDSTCTTASTAPLFTNGTNSHQVTIAANGVIPPSPTLTFPDTGTWYWHASYSGGGRNLAASSSCSSEPLIVQKRQPLISTTPSISSLVVGSAGFSDTAYITAGHFPVGVAPGTVTFSLYGPFTSATAISCTGTAVYTAAIAATRDSLTTASAPSGAYTPTAVGIYQWVASYGGNAQNLSATGLCSDAGERVTVTPATPGIATKILLSDSVKITGVTNAGTPTGTVTFKLFGPFTSVADIVCTGTALSTQGPITISTTDGTASTTSAVAVAAGVYAWGVSFTSTAANYDGTSSACTAEVATVAYESPSPIT